MANEVDLLARDASLDLLKCLRVHNQLNHGWDVDLGHLRRIIVEVLSGVKIVIDRIQIPVRDGVPGASDVAEPYIIALVKEHDGQHWLGNVATPVVKPSVRVLREAMQKEHDALGPLFVHFSPSGSSPVLIFLFFSIRRICNLF